MLAPPVGFTIDVDENNLSITTTGGSSAKLNCVEPDSLSISKDGKLVTSLPKNASVAIEFNNPNDQKDADLGVLYWNGTQWIETTGEKIDGSHFMFDITAEMANSNTFIFVAK